MEESFMKIYRGRIEPAAHEILSRLMKENLIEVAPEEVDEACKDLESVLLEYIRMERELNERAKDIIHKRGLDHSAIGRLRRGLAKERNFGIDDEALDYIVQQMIEIMLSSGHVEEVYGEDHQLNRTIAPIMRRHMAASDEVDREVRQQLRHLEEAEGTVDWEIEYRRKKEELERLKRLR